MQSTQRNQAYVHILEEELTLATGCTEPISIAYASAKARALLPEFPQAIQVKSSGNVIKNAKSVVVPGSGGRMGIEVAALLGAIGGDADQKLNVLESVTSSDVVQLEEALQAGICAAHVLDSSASLHIVVEMQAGAHSSLVEIKDDHTHIVTLVQDGTVLLSKESGENTQEPTQQAPYQLLSLAGIRQFTEEVDLEQVKPLLERQIQYNEAISNEGLQGDYGISLGRHLEGRAAQDIARRASAVAAAASDARMGGCTLPVVINSGSGNQGITVSLPVITYAKHHNLSHEKLLRGLLISNLTAIHIKWQIGRLSAFCGAVSAACGSGAALCYLAGGTPEQMDMTVTNVLANVSGIVCDGAKPSCAAKIASSVDAAFFAYELALKNRVFQPGDGIIKETVEETIRAVAQMAQQGMKETDHEILNIMLA